MSLECTGLPETTSDQRLEKQNISEGPLGSVWVEDTLSCPVSSNSPFLTMICGRSNCYVSLLYSPSASHVAVTDSHFTNLRT